jgi:hypothetical protein
MRYLSPKFLFGEPLPSPLDRKTVQRERKKWLAELELSGGENLELKGHSFSKSEIIDYFETLQQETIAAWHVAIADDPVLLSFLEDGSMDRGTSFKDASLYEDPSFLAWISPYFYTSFTQFAADCFELTDETSMQAIFANSLLMTDEDKERAWTFISNILTKNIAFFDHYHGKTGKGASWSIPMDTVIPYLGHGYIQVIDALPYSKFAPLKDAYAFSMQHPSIALFNREPGKREITITWMTDARNLAVSPDISSQIDNKLQELTRLAQKRRSNKNWHVGWLLFIVIKIVVSLTSSSSNNNFTPANTTFTVDPAINQMLTKPATRQDSAYVDSVFKGHTVPTPATPSQ